MNLSPAYVRPDPSQDNHAAHRHRTSGPGAEPTMSDQASPREITQRSNMERLVESSESDASLQATDGLRFSVPESLPLLRSELLARWTKLRGRAVAGPGKQGHRQSTACTCATFEARSVGCKMLFEPGRGLTLPWFLSQISALDLGRGFATATRLAFLLPACCGPPQLPGTQGRLPCGLQSPAPNRRSPRHIH